MKCNFLLTAAYLHELQTGIGPHVSRTIGVLVLRLPLCASSHNLSPTFQPQQMLALDAIALYAIRASGYSGEGLQDAIPPTFPPVFQSHAGKLMVLKN